MKIKLWLWLMWLINIKHGLSFDARFAWVVQWLNQEGLFFPSAPGSCGCFRGQEWRRRRWFLLLLINGSKCHFKCGAWARTVTPSASHSWALAGGGRGHGRVHHREVLHRGKGCLETLKVAGADDALTVAFRHFCTRMLLWHTYHPNSLP